MLEFVTYYQLTGKLSLDLEVGGTTLRALFTPEIVDFDAVDARIYAIIGELGQHDSVIQLVNDAYRRWHDDKP